jgi:glycosyltransferase involved in cell wall biosynthesis
MKFNILQIVQEFSLDGGVETVAYELQRSWLAAGVPSSVITSAVAQDGRNMQTVRCIAPILNRISTRGRWRHLGRLLVVPAFTVAATSFIRSKAAHAVVLSHGDTLAGDVCVIHAVNKASLQDKIQRGGIRWMLNPLHYWVAMRDRWMIGGLRYRRYVAVSSRIADELNQLYAVPYSRIAVIPNGIDLVRFTPKPGTDADVREEFAIPASAPVLLFAGHEFERKGLAPVIQALSLLPGAYLLVVGSDDPGPYRQMAELAQVADRVRFAGARKDMPRLYRASDAFVFPTSYESFSLVCMEAMACGTPIFATLVGGIEDYLEAGVNGYAITRDPEVIARQLRPVVDNPELLLRLRAGARATAERYSWTLVAERYKDLLEVVWREKEDERSR